MARAAAGLDWEHFNEHEVRAARPGWEKRMGPGLRRVKLGADAHGSSIGARPGWERHKMPRVPGGADWTGSAMRRKGPGMGWRMNPVLGAHCGCGQVYRACQGGFESVRGYGDFVETCGDVPALLPFIEVCEEARLDAQIDVS